MPRMQNQKEESITFRIDGETKNALARLARKDRKSLGALMRGLALEKIEQDRRRRIEEEAARQAREAAAASRVSSDEAAVMRELEDDLSSFGDEWK